MWIWLGFAVALLLVVGAEAEELMFWEHVWYIAQIRYVGDVVDNLWYVLVGLGRLVWMVFVFVVISFWFFALLMGIARMITAAISRVKG